MPPEQEVPGPDRGAAVARVDQRLADAVPVKSTATLAMPVLVAEHVGRARRWPASGGGCAGRIRPCRMSSLRVHISFTGRPIALDTWAGFDRGVGIDPPAERAAAANDVHRHLARLQADRAGHRGLGARSGSWRPARSRPRSDRTSATALPTSIGAWLTNAKSNVPSTYCASSGGTANGAIAEVSLAFTSASDTPSTLARHPS